MKKIVVSLILMLSAQIGVSQSSSIYPVSLLRLSDNFILDNPSSADQVGHPQLQANTSYYTGLAGKVGLNFINGSFKIPNTLKTVFHIPGIVIHSEFETEVLRRTRAYLKYCYSTNITPSIVLSGGVQAGFFNYFVRSSASSAGSSSIVPDASAGLTLKGSRFTLGISSAQLFNSTVKPVVVIYSLDRYYTLYANYRVLKADNISIDGAIRVLLAGSNSNIYNPGIRIILMKNFSAEFNYALKRGYVVSLGAIKFPLLKQQADLHFSYFNTSGMESNFNINRLEIGLIMYFDKDE